MRIPDDIRFARELQTRVTYTTLAAGATGQVARGDGNRLHVKLMIDGAFGVNPNGGVVYVAADGYGQSVVVALMNVFAPVDEVCVKKNGQVVTAPMTATNNTGVQVSVCVVETLLHGHAS